MAHGLSSPHTLLKLLRIIQSQINTQLQCLQNKIIYQIEVLAYGTSLCQQSFQNVVTVIRTVYFSCILNKQLPIHKLILYHQLTAAVLVHHACRQRCQQE